MTTASSNEEGQYSFHQEKVCLGKTLEIRWSGSISGVLGSVELIFHYNYSQVHSKPDLYDLLMSYL